MSCKCNSVSNCEQCMFTAIALKAQLFATSNGKQKHPEDLAEVFAQPANPISVNPEN